MTRTFNVIYGGDESQDDRHLPKDGPAALKGQIDGDEVILYCIETQEDRESQKDVILTGVYKANITQYNNKINFTLILLRSRVALGDEHDNEVLL